MKKSTSAENAAAKCNSSTDNKVKVLLQQGDTALIDMGHQFVVATGFDETQPLYQMWRHGKYFSHWNDEERKAMCLLDAVDCFMAGTRESYISRRRLEELATNFKDGLLEDDSASALEFFEGYCCMDSNEMAFFELEKEEYEDE